MRSRSAATIDDVARAAGVSMTTVSRVMNDHVGVSARTRERVRAAMRRLEYRPHALARGLAARRSQTVGLIITDILDPYFAEIIRGAQEHAQANGYIVLLMDASFDAAREEELVRHLLERRVDGLIVASSMATGSYAEMIASEEIPIVCVNGQRRRFPSSVHIDNVAGARLAVAHLVELGHRRIGHVAGLGGSIERRERLAGYRAILTEASISFDQALVATGACGMEQGWKAAATLLDLPDPPTALFCHDDRSAIGAYHAIRERGLRVGDDVSVTGFDDLMVAGWMDPGLTTVAQPRREMGAMAAELVLKTLRGEVGRSQVTVSPRLVVRESAKHRPPPT